MSELDVLLGHLHDHLHGSPTPLLRPLRDSVWQQAKAWVAACCRLKGIDFASEAAGEEWAMGPLVVLRHLRLLQEPPRPPRFPARLWDALLYPSFRGRIEPDPDPRSRPPGAVTLVLGAGNASAICVTDALHKVFREGAAVLLKLSPALAALRPVLELALAPLLEAGLLALWEGDGEAAEAACRHPGVQAIHLTGSTATWQRLQSLHLGKPLTAEAGCVTPVIVVPGRWSARQLRFQARHLALQLSINRGQNCNAAQVVITSRQWPQRAAFCEAIEQALSEIPTPANQRRTTWLEGFPGARQPGGWGWVPGLDPEIRQRAFQEEAFCGALFETALPGDGFEERALAFCRERLLGDLSCCVLVHPRQRAAALQRLADLPYGSVGINLAPSLLYALPEFPWGAFGGASGAGKVHGSGRRGWLEAPFWHPLRMPWQSGFTRMASLTRAVCAFEHRPSPGRLLQVHLQFFRGAFRR